MSSKDGMIGFKMKPITRFLRYLLTHGPQAALTFVNRRAKRGGDGEIRVGSMPPPLNGEVPSDEQSPARTVARVDAGAPTSVVARPKKKTLAVS